MKKLDPITTANIREEFSTTLDKLLFQLRERASAQLRYNLEVNVPQGIVAPADVVQHAVFHGVVSAVSQMNEYGIEPSIKLAAEILEDVNAHAEAAPLFAALKKLGDSQDIPTGN